MVSLEVKDTCLDTTNSLFTSLLTSSSTRMTFTSQPPPTRNEMCFPIMRKRGDVSFPLSWSPWTAPACLSSEGLFSNPPIHQFPWCLEGCFLSRLVGLSPNVGWLLNAVPLVSQPSIPSSKSKLQAVNIYKKERIRWKYLVFGEFENPNTSAPAVFCLFVCLFFV